MTSLLLAAIVSAWPTQAQLELYQLDLTTDNGQQFYSDWGACDLSFMWHGAPLYLNLSVDGIWGIQNVPVFSGKQIGSMERLRLNFPLPVSPGVPYPMGRVAYSLTSQPSGPPTDAVPTPFAQLSYEIYSGHSGAKMDIVPPEFLIGCLVQDAPTAHENFPNQDCGPLECVPAAVSNSLKFLNAKHSMGLNDADLSIDKMKPATGWVRGTGSPNATWHKTKDKYCNLRKTTGAGPQIPVTTRRFGNHELGRIAAELKDGQDIEIGTDTHCMAVVGITECEDSYTIQVAHDTDQRKPGGTVTETGIINKNSRKIKGVPFVNNQVIRYIVIECPKR